MRREVKIFWNNRAYPITTNCQVLDAQISELRNDKDLVYRGKMLGSKKEVKNFLLAKELQFAQQNCSQKLEDTSVFQTADMIQDEFVELQDRIIGESNKKKQVLLIGGGIVLLIGLVILIK